MTCGQSAEGSVPRATQQPTDMFSGVSDVSNHNPFDPNSSSPKKTRPPKAVIIGAGAVVAILAVVGVVTGIANAKFLNVNSSPELSASLPSAKVEQIAMEKCDALALALPSDATVQTLNQRADALTKYKSGTARKAQDILNASTWVYSTELSDIDGDLAQVTKGALDDVIAKTDTIRESDRGAFAELWSDLFKTMAIEICGLTERADAARLAQASFTAAKSSLESYAATVPWYPEGYSEWSADTNVAWKWAKGLDCDLGDWCWHIKVITASGCPDGVYAELNELDSAGNVIDYSNDSIPRLDAGQTAIMEFSTYNENADTGQMTTITCHNY